MLEQLLVPQLAPNFHGKSLAQGLPALELELARPGAVRVAEAGAYRFEVRRWPREVDAPLAGCPTGPSAKHSHVQQRVAHQPVLPVDAAGHFPGRPIMPGVLIVEALAQTGGILALKAMGGGKRIAYFTGIENCKFRRPVVPGDQLRLEITVIARKGPMWKMHGEARVDGALEHGHPDSVRIPRAGNNVRKEEP